MKKLITLLISVSMLLTCSVNAFASEDTDIYEYENDSNYVQDEKIEEQIAMNIINNQNIGWVIPDYDRSGMSDIEIMRKNYYYYYLSVQGNADFYLPKARTAMAAMNPDGSFPGLDYYDYEYGPQNTMGPNFANVRALYMAYITPGQEMYMNEQIPEMIERNLRFYHATVNRKYKKGVYLMSWWNYTIGIPLNIMPVLALVKDIIPEDLTYALAMDFLYMPDQMESEFVTGQNAVWYAEQSIFRGALLGNEEEIEKGMEFILRETRMVSITDAVSRELTFADGIATAIPNYEGMQPDGSYHMHGPQFYATYGYNTVQDFSIIAMVTQGTKYEPKERYETIVDNLLDGWIWGGRGTEEDVSLLGRTITDKREVLPQTTVIKTVLERFVRLVPEREDELKTAIRYLLPEDDPQRLYLNGTRYFWRSDYLAHHRKDYSVFLHINSSRTRGMEFNDAQAEAASWVGFGNTYLTRDNGDSNTLSTLYWDWTEVPGVTCEKRVPEFDYSGMASYQADNFAGGVSDNSYGAATMRMSKFLGTSAYKSWFFFDDEYVMLGSGITSAGKNPVSTAIEQRFLIGDVEVDGNVIEKGEHNLEKVKTVLHNNIGYVFPSGGNVFLKNKEVVGNYSKISHLVGVDKNDHKADMFLLSASHGLRPSNGEYSVIVLPQANHELLSSYAQESPIEIISNTKEKQAVYHKKLELGYAVFYKNGSVDLSDKLTIKADSACIVMARKLDDGLKISVSNPYNYQTVVNLDVNYNGEQHKLKIELPKYDPNGYDLGGKTVERIIK